LKRSGFSNEHFAEPLRAGDSGLHLPVISESVARSAKQLRLWHQPAAKLLKEAHPNIFLFVPGKRLVFGPTFHLQVRNNVLPSCCRRRFSPPPVNFVDSCLVVPQSPMFHSERRSPGKFVQPAVNLAKGFAEEGDGLSAMFLE
jgi:hypothetical protein